MKHTRHWSESKQDMMMTVTEHDELMLTREYKMTIKELLKLNGKELDIKYPIQLFDDNGNETYCEDSDGYWFKSEIDNKGNQTYFEDANGYWSKKEYDENGNRTYFEDSDDYWVKKEYDENGNRTYYEDSYGKIEDNRPLKK